MLISLSSLVGALKVIAGVAIFFVWVVRYENIKKEFEKYGFPTWFRDLVGILKISFVVLIQFPNAQYVQMGSGGITLLMIGAVITHFRVKNPFREYIPSIVMLLISLIILISV